MNKKIKTNIGAPGAQIEANDEQPQPIEYEYTFSTTDPEGLHIWYYIGWGDGQNTGWIGPYPSGEVITKSHWWWDRDVYTIRCKAKDPYGDESEWGELRVTMPKNQNMWFLRWLERFPILQRLLEVLGRV